MSDWKDWAQRRNSRDGSHVPQHASAPPAPAPAPGSTALPPPPPGMAYIPHPQYGYVLVSLGQAAPPPAPLQPVMHGPPGTIPYVPQPHYATPATPARPAARVLPFQPRTCTLVKPGNRDPYAEMMAHVPDLVPPSPYDAMAGQSSPEVQQELGSLFEFNDRGPGADPTAPTQAYPTAGNGAPVSRPTAPELRPAVGSADPRGSAA